MYGQGKPVDPARATGKLRTCAPIMAAQFYCTAWCRVVEALHCHVGASALALRPAAIYISVAASLQLAFGARFQLHVNSAVTAAGRRVHSWQGDVAIAWEVA